MAHVKIVPCLGVLAGVTSLEEIENRILWRGPAQGVARRLRLSRRRLRALRRQRDRRKKHKHECQHAQLEGSQRMGTPKSRKVSRSSGAGQSCCIGMTHREGRVMKDQKGHQVPIYPNMLTF